ncbi:hypothetical protein CLPU_9c00190 [Gottschalkia purinilytica]|uniref:Uncharacterized protein n=1 Tax=Gottschalkia purinilytica TaxID=1503 RepID=A0A0L0W992_GOTPU|nr:hypothetical protein [Gottschalkia purinilytica]KNF08123.1 hypothetical protein CLPU_9c00190 [Gottschalkia purinilytica]
MQLRKKMFITTLSLITIMLLTVISYAVSPLQQAKTVVKESFPEILSSLESNYKKYEYQTKDQVKKSYLGEPFQHFIIQDIDENKSLYDQIEETSFYVFPVMYNGKIMTDITVSLENNKWKVIDIGGSLNKTIYEVSNKYGLSDSKVLRNNKSIYVVAKKEDKEVAYLPFIADLEHGFKEKEIVDENKFKKHLVEKVKEYVDMEKNNRYENLIDIPVGRN